MERRNFLRNSASVSAVGTVSIGAIPTPATADPSGSITFEDQTSDGSSIIVAEISTDIDAKIGVRNQDADETLVYPIGIEAGTYEDYEIEFSPPITEDSELSVNLVDDDNYGFARETAEVQVDDDVEFVDEIGPTLIEADPNAGFNYPYYLFAPHIDSNEDAKPILVEPNNTGRTDNYDRVLEDTEFSFEISSGRDIAGRLSTPFLMPVFPRPQTEPVDHTHSVHQLDNTTLSVDEGPMERIDLQLLRMVEDARRRLRRQDYPVTDGLLLNGFSATGNFVGRFTAIHPEKVTSVTAGGVNGMPILPLEETIGHTLPYHVGVNDFEELTGEPFDLEAFSSVNRFIYMGEFDDSDTIPYTGSFTEDELRQTALNVYGTHMVEDRFPYAKSIYDQVGASAVFRMFADTGHRAAPTLDDLVEFHERSLQGDDIEAIRDDLGGNVPELGAHIEYSSVNPSVGESITFYGGASAIWGTEIEAYDWQLGEDTKQGETVSHEFETAGGHNITLTITDADGTTHQTTEQFVVGADTSEPELQASFAKTPSAGDDTVFVEWTIPSNVTVQQEHDMRVFGGDGDGIDARAVLVSPGDTEQLGAIVLQRDLIAGEELLISAVTTGRIDKEQANDEGLISAHATVQESTDSGGTDGISQTLVDADPESGFNYPYYLYAPTRSDDSAKPLLVEPTNTGAATDNFDHHRNAGESTIASGIGRTIADFLEVPLLVPVFPRPETDPIDATHYVQALDDTTMAIEGGPLERIDLQLLAMLADARNRLQERDYLVDHDGIILNGFSASGNFVERFATLHPEEVISVSAGGINGMPALPTEEAMDINGDSRTLPYHVGVDNVETLTGNPFDESAFSDVHRFLYMGEIDMNDTIPYSDAWTDDTLRETALDIYGRNMQQDRFPFARAIYDDIDAAAVFREYQGEHHTSRPAKSDIIEFHQRTLAGDDIERIRAHLGGDVPNQRASIKYTPGAATTSDQIAFHATNTDLRTREVVEYNWSFGDSTTATGERVTHMFDSPGLYAVSLFVIDDSEDLYQSTEFIEVYSSSVQSREELELKTDIEGFDHDDTDSSEETGDEETEEPDESESTGEEGDEEPSENETESEDDSLPGFGVGAAITGIGGLGYVLKNRVQSENDDYES